LAWPRTVGRVRALGLELGVAAESAFRFDFLGIAQLEIQAVAELNTASTLAGVDAAASPTRRQIDQVFHWEFRGGFRQPLDRRSAVAVINAA